ncbi:MAG TPA: DUF2156 domain-containing protein [Candidatus Limnocylindrales bacterium]|nr:DUF2156 domain-containing protein [Candidatus Limnocylindrales bacterium]
MAEADFEAARALVLAHGWGANAYQILNPGFRHWFSRDGDAVAGYVRHGRFLVVAGAPVCSEERLDPVTRELEIDIRQRQLRVCYFGVQSRFATRLWASPSHSMVGLGAQPVWNPAAWAAAVDEHPSLRAQFRRARNKGVSVREWTGSADTAGRHDGLQRCLAEWLRTRRAPTMHFLVEPDTLGALEDRRLFVAERNGSVVGFLIASPVPRRNGWLIEQIIRGEGAVNGTSELLVDAAMRSLAGRHAAYVTLGLAPLSRHTHDGEVDTAMWLRLLFGWLRAHGRRFYNFEGLDAFKSKLRPENWEPLYAVTDRARFSPEVLLAIAGAFTGGRPFAMTCKALAWAIAEEARTLAGR